MKINYLYIILFLYNFSFVFFFNKISKLINIFDNPDKKRKLHLKKTACIGGLLVFSNIVIFFLFYFLFFNNSLNIIYLLPMHKKELLTFLIFLIFFAVIGFIDDKYHLNANYKFIFFLFGLYLLVHFDNSLLIKNVNFTFTANSLNIEHISVFFTILSFLLFINAFNMFDGVNLQACIYSIFIFCIFVFKGVYSEFCTVIILSLLFFFFLNLKNKSFLGNNGSLLIAYIISFISIKSVNSLHIFKADEIVLLMLIPGLDLFRLAIFRILNHKHPFDPDRNHIHHLLMNKFGFNFTLIILLPLIIIPNIFSLVFGYTAEVIVYCLAVYSLIIYSLRKTIKK
jgi:UDP-GlcNAc:undecaprenyl-phosphate GlcNAc-1-phosphate transferase